MKRLIIALAISVFAIGMTQTAFADGAGTFKKKCASCHGADGKGDTKMGKKLGAKDLSKSTASDADIKSAIEDGKKNDAGKQVMKGFKGKLSDAEIGELVGYVKSLRK